MEFQKITDLVRALETADREGRISTSRYVQLSMREDIDTTDAYLNSKHISGEMDYMGRDKPFFNVVTAARNIWYRATQIERKDTKLRATKEEDEIEAFLATILLQEWMKKEKFAHFLNDWGLSLASHGSSICKFVEKNGELIWQIMDWNAIIVDPIDFENNPVIERLWFTPAQLKQQKNYNQTLVDGLLDSLQSREIIQGQKKDNRDSYIPVYEVHGLLPLFYLTGKENDKDEFVQQMHVITFKESKNKGEFDDYTLYSGREAKSPYKITHLIKKDGITYSGGAVKNLFQTQWMVNHNVKSIKDQIDLASKLMFQTSDKSFVGQNVITNVENGDILTHEINQPLTMLANNPKIEASQSFQKDWQAIGNEINGISEAMQGIAPKSGTAWRTTQATLQENYSLFALMTENKGLALIDILTDWILPFFKKQLNHSNAISSILDENQIKQIDDRYVPNEVKRRVNNKIKSTILSGKIYDPGNLPNDTAEATQAVKEPLTGSQRFVKPSDIDSKTWKEVFKDLEWELDIDVTGESKDVQSSLATLTTVLQTIAQNPAVLQDPNMKMILGRILSLSGAISPLELQSTPAPQPIPAGAPQPVSPQSIPPQAVPQPA